MKTALAVLMLVFITGDALASKMRTARYYATPPNATCDTVRQYAAQFGTIQNARAYAAVNGILITPTQTRQIHACLRK